jgi:hypothetical protein
MRKSPRVGFPRLGDFTGQKILKVLVLVRSPSFNSPDITNNKRVDQTHLGKPMPRKSAMKMMISSRGN